MKYYELHIEGENLVAVPCEVEREFGEGTSDGFEAPMFKERELCQFFKNIGDGDYVVALGQSLRCIEGRVILPLSSGDDLSSDTPIDRFSWEDDEDIFFPSHEIILKEKGNDG